MLLLSQGVVDVFGAVTVALICGLSLLGVTLVAYVLYFRWKIHRERLEEVSGFGSLWLVRIFLISCAVLWGLTELLRLPLLRHGGWAFHSLSYQVQGSLCRLYLLFSLGLFEPSFFLTALFLVRSAARKAPFTPRHLWSQRVLIRVLAFTLPVFLAQLIFVFILPVIFRKGEGFNGRIPPYFTRSDEREAEQSEVAVCTYPLFCIITLLIFSVLYITYFSFLCWRVARIALNTGLRQRIYGLSSAVAVMLPMHVLFLGLTVLSQPFQAGFEILAFGGFVMVLICTTVGEGVLVIRPIADALAVRWVVDRRKRQRRKADRGGEPTAITSQDEEDWEAEAEAGPEGASSSSDMGASVWEGGEADIEGGKPEAMESEGKVRELRQDEGRTGSPLRKSFNDVSLSGVLPRLKCPEKPTSWWHSFFRRSSGSGISRREAPVGEGYTGLRWGMPRVHRRVQGGQGSEPLTGPEREDGPADVLGLQMGCFAGLSKAARIPRGYSPQGTPCTGAVTPVDDANPWLNEERERQVKAVKATANHSSRREGRKPPEVSQAIGPRDAGSDNESGEEDERAEVMGRWEVELHGVTKEEDGGQKVAEMIEGREGRQVKANEGAASTSHSLRREGMGSVGAMQLAEWREVRFLSEVGNTEKEDDKVRQVRKQWRPIGSFAEGLQSVVAGEAEDGEVSEGMKWAEEEEVREGSEGLQEIQTRRGNTRNQRRLREEG